MPSPKKYEMVEVPGSVFVNSSGRRVRLDTFRIGKYPVTNAQYREFRPGHDSGDGFNADDQPVVMVNWHEAKAYAEWRGCELPTAEQWEKAGYWDPEKQILRVYPWGSEWDPKKANTFGEGPGRTTPVGAYPEGASAYGCFGMAGNVWEWCADGDEGSRVLRGGCWVCRVDYVRAGVRFAARPAGRDNDLGFRLVSRAPMPQAPVELEFTLETDASIIQRAKARAKDCVDCDFDIEVLADAKIDHCDDAAGHWVGARVWVPCADGKC